MPTDFECAALALDVYRGDKRPPLPSGWKIYCDYKPVPDDKGYFGACYIKEIDCPIVGKIPTEILFAHRGTILSTQDLITDLWLALGEVPDQYANAKKFYDDTVIKLKKSYPTIAHSIESIITQVGHSLGAIIAEIMCAATFYIETLLTRRAVSFESPGSKQMIESMIEKKSLPPNALNIAKKNCTIIQTHVNIINACNEQINDVNTLDIPFNYDVFDGPISIVPSEYFENYYYIIGYSFLDQHKIQHIYDYLKAKKKPSFAGKWPFGFENGYLHYKSLRLENYWDDGYIKICWDTHPLIQWYYNYQYDEYYNYFVKEYLSDSSLLDKLTKSFDVPGLFPTKVGNFIVFEEESIAENWINISP